MKKVLVMMMCVIMVVCFMPTVAMAEGEDTVMLEASLNGTNVQKYTVAQLNGFFSDLQNATTADVKLLNNISLAKGTYIEIKDGQTVTLDFNGCTIIKNDSSPYAPIENYGIMILRDASEIGNGGISGVNRCVNNYGKMTIKNGYFTTSSNQGGTAVQNKTETAVMTIEDCVVNAAGTFGFSNAGIATINGGIFENYVSCSQCNPTGWAYTAKSTGKLYVYGGEIHGVQGALAIVAGYAEIHGGTFYAHACKLGSHSSADIGGNAFYGLYVAGEDDDVKCVVYDGTFKSDGKHAVALIGNDNTNGDGGINANATSEIKGGTFTATLEGTPALKGAPITGNPTITGGTFSSDVSQYVPKGTKVVETIVDDVTKYTLAPITEGENAAVAQVGDAGFTTLQAAIAAAADGQTVKLLCDIPNAQGISVPSGKNFILDFAGHTYTLTGPGAGSSNTETNGFQLKKDSDITFKNGTIRIAENADNIKRIIQNYANLKLENMQLYSKNQVGGEDYPLSFNNGKIVFSGNTSVITSSDNNIAFDVYYWKNYYPNGTSVTFDNSYTGTINGKILYDSVDPEKAKLVINGNGSFGAVETSKDTTNGQSITISGGKFNTTLPQDYLAPGVVQDSKGNVYKPYYGGSIPTDSLKAARTEAIKAVSDYVNAADYEEAQQAELKTIVDNAKKDIEAAKTADEIKAIEAAAKAELDKLKTAEEMALIRAIEETKFVARSKAVTLKNGKKAIKITWYDKNGKEVKFDGVEIFRSTKRYSGYGKEPIYVSKSGVYYNTAITPGTKYYYKVRGYVTIDGEKVYTDYSTKARRTVK